MKNIVILGSTGSIGTQTLDVMERLNIAPFALAAKSNAKLMEEQIRKFKPKFAALFDEKAAAELKIAVADTQTKILQGSEGINFIVTHYNVNMVLSSFVGIAGLEPTIKAIEAKKEIALANKEVLVCAGELVMQKARENNVNILPVDSEHSAIFQCLQGTKQFEKIILTASGGAFFGMDREGLKTVKTADALKNPNWVMGAKVTVDSASLMNKGFELIEAMWLFNAEPEQIEIVIHRESVIHSMVEFEDLSVIAQLSNPDMRLPIQYAITYPDKFVSPVKPLDLTEISKLTFFKPDASSFECLEIAKKAAKKKGSDFVVMNAANEIAVQDFIDGKIGFLEIPEKINRALSRIKYKERLNFEDIIEIDKETRELA